MLTKRVPRAVLDKLRRSRECGFLDEVEVKGQDYQQ